MQAVLNRPIITDYVPAVQPPWLLLTVLVGVIAYALPREALPFAVMVSVGIIAACGLANWSWRRFGPTDTADEVPAENTTRRAA